jgi:hypothetical protein
MKNIVFSQIAVPDLAHSKESIYPKIELDNSHFYIRGMEEIKEKYGNTELHSTITHYAIGETYINIWFGGLNHPKKYSFKSATEAKVLKMIELAKAGKGLNRYIIIKAKGLYERTA